jgi:hypothetical protein|tara:strand:+ start:3174 stop:3320 length:147 start_codon:yes stop_codon:yes gene_type:complete
MLTFLPARTEEDVLRDIIINKNKQSKLKIELNKLIDELVLITNGENND